MPNLEKELWGKVKKYIKYLKWIPSLRMVGVCNNLAFGQVDEKSDIDLFIIAKKGRLFTVRFLVTAVLHILGVRRHGNKVAGRFCLSFFVDDSSLGLEPIALKNDIYLAYWIKTMKPVLDDGVSEDFLAANYWFRDYFDETGLYVDTSYLFYKKKSKSKLSWLISPFISKPIAWVFEERFKRYQLKSAKHKASKLADISGTIINDHMLKFHDVDRRKKYSRIWAEKHGKAFITDQKFKDLF